MSDKKQPNVLDAMNFIYQALEKANKYGNKVTKDYQLESLFSMEETANLFNSMIITKKYFENILEEQKKQKKLSTIKENTETI